MKTLDLGKVSISPKGIYDAETQYHPLDIVTHNGSSYLVLKDALGITPSEGEYYQLLSQKGKDGEKGDPGEKGEKGDTGPKGDTGARGSTGYSGSNATINGYNSITLRGGTGISVSQSGSTCTISQSSSAGASTYGQYNGNDASSKSINMGFTPSIVIIWEVESGKAGRFENDAAVVIRPSTKFYAPQSNSYQTISWTSSGVTITTSDSSFAPLNDSGRTYYWAAV